MESAYPSRRHARGRSRCSPAPGLSTSFAQRSRCWSSQAGWLQQQGSATRTRMMQPWAAQAAIKLAETLRAQKLSRMRWFRWVRIVLFVVGFIPAAGGWLVDRPEEFPGIAKLFAREPADAASALTWLENHPKGVIRASDPGFPFLRQHWPKSLEGAFVVGIGRSGAFVEMPEIDSMAPGMEHPDIELRAMINSTHHFKDTWSLWEARILATSAMRWRLTWWSAVMLLMGTLISLGLGLDAFRREPTEQDL